MILLLLAGAIWMAVLLAQYVEILSLRKSLHSMSVPPAPLKVTVTVNGEGRPIGAFIGVSSAMGIGQRQIIRRQVEEWIERGDVKAVIFEGMDVSVEVVQMPPSPPPVRIVSTVTGQEKEGQP